MEAHLPALQVVVPLFGALLCALVRRPGPAWVIAFVVGLAMPVISWLLLERVLAEGAISYHLGGWDPSSGIEYRVDVVNAFVLMLVSTIAAVIAPFARLSVAAEIPKDRIAWFYTMYLIALTGLLGIPITGDAINAYVFIEIT